MILIGWHQRLATQSKSRLTVVLLYLKRKTNQKEAVQDSFFGSHCYLARGGFYRGAGTGGGSEEVGWETQLQIKGPSHS